MMRVRVKICGLTDAVAVRAAVDAGADAVGFVFADSVRRVDPAQARELCRMVPPFVARVAVFQNPGATLVEAVRQAFDPDWYQSDADDLAMFEALGARYLPVFREGASEDQLQHYLGSAPQAAFVYEGRISGAGARADWDLAAPLSRRGKLVLAGGLDPENVAEAILRVRPFAVDVSSGVEARPGVKDPVRIRAFLAAVRDTERRIAARSAAPERLQP